MQKIINEFKLKLKLKMYSAIARELVNKIKSFIIMKKTFLNF